MGWIETVCILWRILYHCSPIGYIKHSKTCSNVFESSSFHYETVQLELGWGSIVVIVVVFILVLCTFGFPDQKSRLNPLKIVDNLC